MAETVSMMIRIPERLRNQARAVAALRGETLSDVVRDGLRAYVRRALEEVHAAPEAYTRAGLALWAEIERQDAEDARQARGEPGSLDFEEYRGKRE